MASPKDLVAEVAKQTGVPVNTVVQHDRNLSLAGLRTVAGRGRAAATVTYADAANLLIAVAGSRNVKDSASTVRLYGAMVSQSPLVLQDAGADIPWGVTFHAALTSLLEAVPQQRNLYSGPEGDGIVVSLFGPEPRASISVNREGAAKPLLAKYEISGRPFPVTDLHFISRFSQVTIGHVGDIISGGSSTQ